MVPHKPLTFKRHDHHQHGRGNGLSFLINTTHTMCSTTKHGFGSLRRGSVFGERISPTDKSMIVWTFYEEPLRLRITWKSVWATPDLVEQPRQGV